MRLASLRALIIPFSLAGGYALVEGCGSDHPSGPTGGDVTGAADMHCVASDGGLITQTTSAEGCTEKPPDAPAGTPDAPDDTTGDYGATMFNQSGNDDDCKYHVSWTSTAIYENFDVHFTLTVNNLTDNSPATGAAPYMEITLNDLHSAPPTDPKSNETSPGVYDIGPIQFDMPGQWLIRFHMYGTCLDYADDSPHGHAAFFLNVP